MDIPQHSAINAFKDGIVVEVLNVKTVLFFLSFIPHFIVADRSPALQFLVLGTACLLINSMVDLAAVYAASALKKLWSKRQDLLFMRLSGGVMLALGAMVLYTEGLPSPSSVPASR